MASGNLPRMPIERRASSTDSAQQANADDKGRLTGLAFRRLPAVERQRRPGLAALAVLLILGGALATTVLVLRADDRISAIRITEQIGAGQPFRLEAMQEALIADPGTEYALWSRREQVAKTFARVTVLPGSLLTTAMTTTGREALTSGKSRVGLALKPGQFPSDLHPGYRVQVVHVPRSSPDPRVTRVLAENALVDNVTTSRTGASGVMVTVVTDSSAAAPIAVYASNGEVAIVEVPTTR